MTKENNICRELIEIAKRIASSDLSVFINNWYLGRGRNLAILEELAREYPYSGKAFRATDNKKGEEPWVRPPTSWSKSLEAVKEYASHSEDVSGYLIEANVQGVDLEKLAKAALKGSDWQTKERARKIIKVKEVIALQVGKVNILKFLEAK